MNLSQFGSNVDSEAVFPVSTLILCFVCPAALPARARRKASSGPAALDAAPGEAAPGCELYPVPCNLGVVAMDESTIELNFCADGDEHGARLPRSSSPDRSVVASHWVIRVTLT